MEKKQFIPSAEQITEGIEIANKLGHSEIIVNEKGEYFTSRNLALLSVAQDETKIAKIDLTAQATASAAISGTLSGNPADQSGAQNTGDEADGDGEVEADDKGEPEEAPAETAASAEAGTAKKGARKTGTAK